MPEFRLPDVGEGLTEAEIVSWKVKEGDVVAINDVVVEIETAKSLVELPVPFAGAVTGLLVPEGTTVPVGTPIIRIGDADAGPPAAPEVVPESREATAAAAAAPAAPAAPEMPAREPVLVGYGPRQGPAVRRARRSPATGAPEAAAEAVNATFSTAAPVAVDTTATSRVLAKPPVRKLAKDRGIDLATVTPTGPHGTITRSDLDAIGAAAPGRTHPAGSTGWHDLPREERVPVRSVRKATAEAMVRSAFTAPHVTEWVQVDVTRTMRLVGDLRGTREYRDVRLSPMTVLARAMCVAVRRTPEVNARWDEAAGEIVLQRFVDLGIAAATPRGLVVPIVRDADRLGLAGLAGAIDEVVATARAGRSQPADLAGGTMTITNVGVFGVDGGTPILPPGQASIMAFGAVAQRPWVHKGRIRPRQVTTLALSFDHRLVDGEQGSRFLADVALLLEHPARALGYA